MALEGTHMRFALDIKDRLEVANVCEYLSGTVYPDSRHFTGIDRLLTHPKSLLERDPLSLTDFKKGCFAHMLCDRMQYFLTMEQFPEIAAMEEREGNTRWVKHTALKLLQDLEDIQKFDIKGHLHCLAFVLNPNDEDTQKIMEYNIMIQDLYADPAKMTPTSFDIMWERSNVDEEVGVKIVETAQTYERDEQVMSKLRGFYSEILSRAEENLRLK